MFLSVSEIISKSKLTHSIEYDYSKVVDSKLSDNITIICPSLYSKWSNHQKSKECDGGRPNRFECRSVYRTI